MYNHKEYVKEHRKRNLEKYREYTRRGTRRWYRKVKAAGKVFYDKEKQTQYLKRVREEVLTAYGGVCSCCGESRTLFLELDHVNNDGAMDRKYLPGHRLYFWLRRNDYPEGYQVLCANCNRGKYRNGGVCPHITG